MIYEQNADIGELFLFAISLMEFSTSKSSAEIFRFQFNVSA
jgi:hypothetical protein